MNDLKISFLDESDLDFDYRNPRLAEFNLTENTGDGEVLQILWNAMSVEEIVLSIAASGFFVHEPLIVVREKIKKVEKNIVIEGNRRLAAVKSILHPDLLTEYNIHVGSITVSPTIKKVLKVLPVIIVESREDAWKYIGFKHINGPAKWGSYAKAQYISQIHKDFKIPLNSIALQIGDTNKTVEKLYQGFRVLEQAEEKRVFDKTDITGSRLYFSHLYTALGYEGIREYLDLREISTNIEYPVNPKKIEELGNFLTWLFGSKKKGLDPIIKSQNPDLRRLDSVLKKSESTVALRNGTPLITAFEISQPNQEVFEESLVAAKQNLLKAHSYWTLGYNHELEPLQLAGDIFNLAEELYQAMEKKYEEKKTPNLKPKKRIAND